MHVLHSAETPVLTAVQVIRLGASKLHGQSQSASVRDSDWQPIVSRLDTNSHETKDIGVASSGRYKDVFSRAIVVPISTFLMSSMVPHDLGPSPLVSSIKEALTCAVIGVVVSTVCVIFDFYLSYCFLI